MRWLMVLAAVQLAGCCERADDRHASSAPAGASREPGSGEVRARIAPRGEAATLMRSGPQVPIDLPPGFTLYPGAQVISNTVVERAGARRVLLVFETPDALAEVMLFYRAQARGAGVALSLDLGGEERASIGGPLVGGGELAIAARRGPAGTRVEISANRAASAGP